MGILLSVLGRGGGSSSDANIPQVTLDFEHVQPSPQETEIYAHVSELFRPTNSLLESLRSYTGCQDAIRQAISNPTLQTERMAWNAVQPAVGKLKRYFEYSASLEDALPELLGALTGSDAPVYRVLEQRQAIAKLLADVLDFAFQFDALKMKTPSMQNDFSYYRRTLSRGKLDHSADIKTAMVEDELASRISLFYAQPNPMLKTVTDAVNLHIAKSHDPRNVASCFSGLAAAAYHAVTKQRLSRPESIPYCLRVMTVSIILYDTIDPMNQGAFAKSSPINVRASVRAIQSNCTGNDQEAPLLSALKHNTKHLNDASTPKAVKQLLAGA